MHYPEDSGAVEIQSTQIPTFSKREVQLLVEKGFGSGLRWQTAAGMSGSYNTEVDYQKVPNDEAETVQGNLLNR